MKLTPNQYLHLKELANLPKGILANSLIPKTFIKFHIGTLNSLALKNLVSFNKNSKKWRITKAGRAVLKP